MRVTDYLGVHSPYHHNSTNTYSAKLLGFRLYILIMHLIATATSPMTLVGQYLANWPMT